MGFLIPIKGRRFLPPDSETAEALLTQLTEFHRVSAGVLHRGPEHVAKQTVLADAVLRALIAHCKSNRP